MALTKVITGVTDLNQAQSTNGLKFPTGGAFAGTPEEGMIRNDQSQSSATSSSTMQFYNGTAWKNFVNKPIPLTVDYLVVAGGGGSSTDSPGGGGAGGLRTSWPGGSGGGQSSESTLLLAVNTNYTLTVGSGGAAASDGSNTTFSGIFGLNP